MSDFDDNIVAIDGVLRAPIISALIETPKSINGAKWLLFGNVQSYTTFWDAMLAHDVKVHSIHPLEGEPSVNATDRR